MGNQVGVGRHAVRAAARSAAAATRARLKAELVERERLRDRLSESVVVELAARDAAVVEHELAAGVALERLVGEVGLTVTEASAWCGGLPVREVNRLRHLAASREEGP